MKNVTILVVDDNDDYRGLIADTFMLEGEEHGFCVTTLQAENGAEALEIINKQHVGLVCTDGDMPIMTGFMLIQELVSKEDAPPFMLLSGNEPEVLKMKKNGVPALLKPPMADELVKLAFSLIKG